MQLAGGKLAAFAFLISLTFGGMPLRAEEDSAVSGIAVKVDANDLTGKSSSGSTPGRLGDEPEKKGWFGPAALEPAQKNIIGTSHYFSNDSSLRIGLPLGFSVNGAYNFYRSDTSSRTATIYVGAGKDWEEGFLNVTYSWTPLTNNYRSHSIEMQGAYIIPTKHYRTVVGGTFNTTYNTQMIPGTKVPSVYAPLDIRQMTGTFNLKQRIYDAKLTLDAGKSTYDREIPRLSNRINPNSTLLQGLEGLLQGFPDIEWKIGAYYDVGDYFTVWATYDHIRLIIAQDANHGNSDSYMIGTDIYTNTWLTATLQYNYVAQTSQPPSDLYGLSVSLRP